MGYTKLLLLAPVLLAAFLNISCSDSSSSDAAGGSERIYYSNFANTPGDTGGVYSMNTNGSDRIRIHSGSIFSAPRGNSLLIVKTIGGFTDSVEFLLTDLFGNNEKKLFGISGIINYAILSPNGKYVAYNYYNFGSRWYLRLRNLEDNTDIPIGDTIETVGQAIPVFSPDSKRLLYASKDFTISVMNVDGTEVRALVANSYVNHSSAYYPQSFDWSSDGSKLCYAAIGNSRIEKLSFYDVATGSLTSHDLDTLTTALPVHISPKGTYLLFGSVISSAYHGNQYIAVTPWVYNIAAAQSKEFPIPSPTLGHGVVDYSWSSDEKKLLIQSTGSNPDGSGLYETIYLVDIASGNVTDLQMPGVGFCQMFWSRSQNP